MDLDAALRRLAADPTARVDLAAVALGLAADEYPALDVPAHLHRVADLAAAVRPRLASGSLSDKVAGLSAFLFAEQRFAGNAADYYDPRNSYLNDVLDRRLGIPLTLSVLAAVVGSRAGLAVAGVGLPGHFIAKATSGRDEVLFDPFHGGRPLDRADCEHLVASVTGEPFAATDAALAATPPGFVVQRMLNNLKGVYLQRPDYPRAARVIGRLVQLLPGDPSQRRDLGVALVHAGRPGKAIGHLTAYLEAVPAADDVGTVEEFLKDARRQVARWN